MNNPLVSVIVPVYNQANFLSESLLSIFNQLYENFECIIINDGSTDNSLEIASSFCKTDNRFQCFSQENMGLSAARNLGIKNSYGKYLAFLDADDTWEKTMLENSLLFYQNSDPYVVCFGNYQFIDSNSNVISKIIRPVKEKITINDLIWENFFPVHTLLVPRKLFDDCGYFDESLFSLEDYDLWIRAAIIGYKFIHIDKLFANYRIHSSNMTSNTSRTLINWEKLTQKNFDLKKIPIYDFHRTFIQMRWFLEFARRFKESDDKKMELEMVQRAFQNFPVLTDNIVNANKKLDQINEEINAINNEIREIKKYSILYRFSHIFRR